MSVGQKDIAQLLGVDRSTVAHALRGDPRVANATRVKVEETARALGYSIHSNREARSLIARRYGKRHQTGILAVLMMNRFHGVPLRSVPFYMPLLDGIEIEAGERDLDLYFSSWHNERLPHLIEERGVDGVICLPSTFDIPTIQRLGLPVVTVVNSEPGTIALSPDDRRGTWLATRHLVDLGHTRIAFLGMVQNATSHRLRLQGYHEAMAGLEVAPEWIEFVDDPSRETGAKGMAQLLRRARFTALVCYNDLLAMGAIDAAREIGLEVPRQLSVVGFDDVGESYAFSPRVTSIRFDRLQMGRRAVQLICQAQQRQHIAQTTSATESTNAPQDAAQGEVELSPVELIVHDSTCAPG